MISDDGCVITNKNVVLVDPNCVNTKIGLVNEIPDYEKMYIYVDLTATRRGRTVLQTGVSVSAEDVASTDDAVSVNMMGFNQNKDSSDYGNFTTNYYDGSTGNATQYESFGIESIKVTINSSFIPQVNIKFIDIRGLSFFNNQPDGKDSPYRILFDFPPPIFNLTLKGYYGRGLSYQLHLVKYTSDFRSETGNFHIDADFVALTFAPLADTLFRYVVNMPLIRESVNPNPGERPNNTFDLITKVQALNHAKSLFEDTDVENDEYDDLVKGESAHEIMISTLSNALSSSMLNTKQTKSPVFLIHDRTEDTENTVERNPFRQINDIRQFNDVLLDQQRLGIESSPEKRLYIAYQLGSREIEEIPEEEDDGLTDFSVYSRDKFEGVSPAYTRRINYHRRLLDDYRDNLVETAASNFPNLVKRDFEGRIKRSSDFQNNYGFDGYTEETLYTYVYLDITDFYTYLYKNLAQIRENKADIMDSLNRKINNMILEKLGIKPTIYNIFKIILDDVDKMYEIMREFSIAAEDNHHNEPDINNLIVNFNYRDISGNKGNETHIYAYPLVINHVERDGVIREERVAPIRISESLGNRPFPELVLISEFIDSFRRQDNIIRQLILKTLKNVDGTYRWIPLSPFDSKTNSTNINTPYLGIDTGGIVSETTPTPTLGDSKIVQIMTVLLKRYYILTQYVYPITYGKSVDDTDKQYKVSLSLMNLFASAEAINLSVSIVNEELRNLLLTFSRRYKNNIGAFNAFLNTNMNNLYTLSIDPEEISGTNVEFRDYIRLNENIYVNKNNDNYIGCKVIVARGFNVGLAIDRVSNVDKNEITDANRPIFNFTEEVAGTWWQKFQNFFQLKVDDINVRSFGYSDDNLFYLRNNINEVMTRTRFIIRDSFIKTENDNVILRADDPRGRRFVNKENLINDIVAFDETTGEYGGNLAIDRFGTGVPTEYSVDLVWRENIINNFDKMSDVLFDSTAIGKRFASILILSNFGYSASMFNTHRQGLNESIFTIPSIVQVPEYLPAYIGALIDIEISEDDEIYQKLREFFIGGDGNELDSGGIFIFADIVDIKNSLSENDKQEFRFAYANFMNRYYDTLIANIFNLNEEFSRIRAISQNDKNPRERQRTFLDKELSESGKYYLIYEQLLRNVYILNYSENTFKRKSQSPQQYVAMNDLNNNYTSFFRTFFIELEKQLNDRNNEEVERDNEAKKLTGDEDIITQTYYSFKNINDKWLTNPRNNNIYGFPFNEPTGGLRNERPGNLIDLFAFVDRAMNPAGDTVINPEILADFFDDPNVSLYGVLSQLLSSNGFEFFPLQNFMSFETDKSWEDSFKLDESGNIKTSPNFVCMYIGGSSSYVTGINRFNNFVDDGIVDLSGPGLGTDFVKSNVVQDDIDEDNQRATNTRFPWGEVRAFRVRFAEQNQTMFRDMKIESKEFPETNESIQILSRLAGDNRANAPVPKGQNLYNLYENRAYSATITGLGNMMIQPTQYFQLDNVPLYNGAYLILSVEHDIEPNKMTTTFSGTKILKYPVPRVTNPASILGFDEGATEQTNAARASQSGGATGSGNVSLGGGTNQNPDGSDFYSMYDQKIEE